MSKIYSDEEERNYWWWRGVCYATSVFVVGIFLHLLPMTVYQFVEQVWNQTRPPSIELPKGSVTFIQQLGTTTDKVEISNMDLTNVTKLEYSKDYKTIVITYHEGQEGNGHGMSFVPLGYTGPTTTAHWVTDGSGFQMLRDDGRINLSETHFENYYPVQLLAK